MLLLAACTPPEPPQLFINKQALAFGTVEVNGGTFRQAFRLSNSGGGTLRITTLWLESESDELELSGAADLLESGQRANLAILYRPTSEGPISGVLHVDANDGQGPRTLEISGQAGRLGAALDVQPGALCGVTPSSLDFGTVTHGTPVTREFSVTSTGTAPITVLKATLNPAGAGFEVAGPFGEPLAPGRVATFTIAYDPTLPGGQAVAVTLDTNSVLQPRLTLAICGTGLVEALCVTPPELDLGAVQVGDDRVSPLQVTSCGNLPVTLTAVTLVSVNDTPGFSLPILPTLPRVMPEGDSFELPVRFDGIVAGRSARQKVRLENSSPVSPAVEVSVGANLPPPCSVSLTPNPLSFFNVVPAAPLRLTNLGARDCSIQRMSIVQSRGSFTFERRIDTPAVLPARASMEIPIRYTPGMDPETATLEIELDFVRSVTLRGDPRPPPGCRLQSLRREVDFGRIATDAPVRSTLTLLNAGADPCLITSATADQTSLSVEVPQEPIESQQTVSLEVVYDPGGASVSLTGTITVTSNDRSSPLLTVPVVARPQYCDAQCTCGDDETLAYWRYSSSFTGSSVTTAGPGATSMHRSCERRACSGTEVLVEETRGQLSCVPAPLDCGNDGLDFSTGWQCVPCPLIVQFGGLFDSLRTCAPLPNLTCGPGHVPTFDATTRVWDCAATCDNGLYDQRLLDGQLVCVPC